MLFFGVSCFQGLAPIRTLYFFSFLLELTLLYWFLNYVVVLYLFQFCILCLFNLLQVHLLDQVGRVKTGGNEQCFLIINF